MRCTQPALLGVLSEVVLLCCHCCWQRLQLFMKRLELCDDPAAKEYLRYTTAQMMEGGRLQPLACTTSLALCCCSSAACLQQFCVSSSCPPLEPCCAVLCRALPCCAADLAVVVSVLRFMCAGFNYQVMFEGWVARALPKNSGRVCSLQQHHTVWLLHASCLCHVAGTVLSPLF